MTVTIDTRSIVYNGDGSTTAFHVDFYFLENGDLVVTLIDSSGVDHVQTITTDYTVSGAGDEAGGTVTMLTAPAVGEKLRIERLVDILQPTNYPENTRFPAASHERALDRLTMIDQQQQGEINRAPKFSETSGVVDIELPTPEDGKGIKFDAETGKYVNTELDPDQAQEDAEAAKEAAEAAQAAAEAALSDFEEKYLGAYADDAAATAAAGGSPIVGALYWNTTIDGFRIWNGAAWADAGYGDMLKSMYDPQAVEGDAFDGSNLHDETVTRPKLVIPLSRSIPVSPLEFGAVGDGVTDDTAALQAWASSGGPLVGVPQTFRVTDTIDFTTDFALDGRGMEIEHDTADPNPVVQVTDVEQFGITGLKINGRKDLKPGEQTTAHGIRVEGCENYIISGNHIRNTHEHAISNYSTNTPEIDNIASAIVTNNIIEGCGNDATGRGYGIWFFGYIEKVVITGNHIKDCVSGIGYDDASSGGSYRDSREAVISNNVVFTHLDAIRFESSSIGTITGNVAVSLHDGTVPGGSFICGMMVRAIQSHVDPCNRVAVTGNYIQGPQFGFYSADVEDLVVSGNVIKLDNVNDVVYGSNRVALKIDKSSSRPCRDILITGNMIRSDERGIESNVPGSVTDYIENVSILGNTVIYEGDTPTGTAQRGIYVSSTYDAFVRDNVVKGFYQGITVTTINKDAESDPICVITGNVSTDNVNSGINIGSTGQTVVYGNFTRGNGDEGISYSASANTKESWRALNFSRETQTSGGGVSTPAPNYPFPGMEVHSAAALGAAGSAINITNKYQGKVLIDSTNNRLMYAVGPAPTDDWRVVDGSASITPA